MPLLKGKFTMKNITEVIQEDKLNHLKSFDLNTARGWFLLLGLSVFSLMAVVLFFTLLIQVVGIVTEGKFDSQVLINIVISVFGMFPFFMVLNAIKGKHFNKVTLILLTIVFFPVGLYFLFLRIYDERLLKKELNTNLNKKFIFSTNGS